jgi:hypothetical protein
LNVSNNAKGRALAKILADKLCGLSPCLAINEVGFLLLVFPGLAVYSKRERANGNAARSLLEFYVCGQSTAKNYFVKI